MSARLLLKFVLVFALLIAVGIGTYWIVGRDAQAQPPSDRLAVKVVAGERPAGTVDYALLDNRIEQLMEENRALVGLAVATVEDGEITFVKGYGERTDEGEPVDIDTRFRWASVSKGVAGVMAAHLAAERRLSLDIPIANYTSSLRLPENNQFKATLRDVLSHRLGLWRNAYDDKLEEGKDPRDIRRQLGDLAQICPVGQCWSYQNIAFDASSEAVEKVTGKSYEEALREELFGPLGMLSASASRSGLVDSDNWAPPHNRGRRAIEVDEDYFRVPAAGGVNSSILDLATWLQAQMGEFPEILPADVLTEAHRPLIDTAAENRRMREYRERLSDARYGLGWRTYDYAGHRVVGHRGGVDGYRSFILFDPERKAGIVAMWNANSGQPHGLQFEFLDLLYGLEGRDWLELGATPET